MCVLSIPSTAPIQDPGSPGLGGIQILSQFGFNCFTISLFKAQPPVNTRFLEGSLKLALVLIRIIIRSNAS